MAKIKLMFEETVKYIHEIIIETELPESDVIEILEDMESDNRPEDVACVLEKKHGYKCYRNNRKRSL
jgi:hypothetical protein